MENSVDKPWNDRTTDTGDVKVGALPLSLSPSPSPSPSLSPPTPSPSLCRKYSLVYGQTLQFRLI